MEEGEREENVDINIEILVNILKDVLDNRHKRKAISINYLQKGVLSFSDCVNDCCFQSYSFFGLGEEWKGKEGW